MPNHMSQPIADEIRESRDRIRAADPEAYSGFVTDEAVRAVADRRGLTWREALILYRAKYSIPPKNAAFGIPPGAKPVSEEAKAVA